MSDYTKDEIMAMQEDALRRVREMQRRANQNMNNSTNRQQRSQASRPASSQPPPIPPSPQKEHTHPSSSVSPSSHNDGSLQSAIQRMNIDSDILVLLILLFVLMQEGADESLLLAICYLII